MLGNCLTGAANVLDSARIHKDPCVKTAGDRGRELAHFRRSACRSWLNCVMQTEPPGEVCANFQSAAHSFERADVHIRALLHFGNACLLDMEEFGQVLQITPQATIFPRL